MRSKQSSRRCGLTLVEVAAALALMGTLLVAAVTARARHMHQFADSQQRLAAIDAADELIAGWYGAGDTVPPDGEGVLPDHHDLRWYTHVIDEPNDGADELGIQIVRLTVHGSNADRSSPWVTVDLAVPAADADGSPEVESESR